MKILKTLGITCLVSGTALLGGAIYNDIKHDQMNREYFEECMFERHRKTILEHNKAKYDSLANVTNDKYIWAQEAAKVRDSVSRASQATRAYFDGGKLASDTLKTAKKIIK